MKCPKCNKQEVEASTPRTVYHCGSNDYDQRPGTFRQSPDCRANVLWTKCCAIVPECEGVGSFRNDQVSHKEDVKICAKAMVDIIIEDNTISFDQDLRSFELTQHYKDLIKTKEIIEKL